MTAKNNPPAVQPGGAETYLFATASVPDDTDTSTEADARRDWLADALELAEQLATAGLTFDSETLRDYGLCERGVCDSAPSRCDSSGGVHYCSASRPAWRGSAQVAGGGGVMRADRHTMVLRLPDDPQVMVKAAEAADRLAVGDVCRVRVIVAPGSTIVEAVTRAFGAMAARGVIVEGWG